MMMAPPPNVAPQRNSFNPPPQAFGAPPNMMAPPPRNSLNPPPQAFNPPPPAQQMTIGMTMSPPPQTSSFQSSQPKLAQMTTTPAQPKPQASPMGNNGGGGGGSKRRKGMSIEKLFIFFDKFSFSSNYN